MTKLRKCILRECNQTRNDNEQNSSSSKRFLQCFMTFNIHERAPGGQYSLTSTASAEYWQEVSFKKMKSRSCFFSSCLLSWKIPDCLISERRWLGIIQSRIWLKRYNGMKISTMMSSKKRKKLYEEYCCQGEEPNKQIAFFPVPYSAFLSYVLRKLLI